MAAARNRDRDGASASRLAKNTIYVISARLLCALWLFCFYYIAYIYIHVDYMVPEALAPATNSCCLDVCFIIYYVSHIIARLICIICVRYVSLISFNLFSYHYMIKGPGSGAGAGPGVGRNRRR